MEEVNHHSSNHQLHIFFLPFLTPGHIVPVVQMAKLMAASSSPAIKASIVTTTGNVHHIQPDLDRFRKSCPGASIDLLTLPFPSGVQENINALPTPQPTEEFIDAMNGLRGPFERLVEAHGADGIVSDFYYPWTNDVASRFGIPRIIFNVMGFFPSLVMNSIRYSRVCETVAGDFEPFTVPNLPHDIKLSRSQIDPTLSCSAEELGLSDYWTQFVDQMVAAASTCYGNIMNSFYELEGDYVDIMKGYMPCKVWNVGPLPLALSRVEQEGTPDGGSDEECLRWLDTNKAKSVLYMGFGSLGKFVPEQITEMAVGLEASGSPFIWVLKDEEVVLPEGFEGRVDGLVLRGWVPQKAMLGHAAMGAFVTHCGWNSLLEGLCAGLPMVTWPLFCEQFMTEKLVVDVLRTGVAVGSKLNSLHKEERTLVKGEQLSKAVQEVMGAGEEAEERRGRAAKLAAAARAAVEDGGSSHKELRSMIDDLMDAKLARATKENKVNGI